MALLPESIYGEMLLGKEVMQKPNLGDRLFSLGKLALIADC